MGKKKWIIQGLTALGILIVQWMIMGVDVKAVGTLYESPYVTFSPDGKAWTIGQTLPKETEDGRPVFWFPKGYTISTGIASGLRSLQEGEHYYAAKRYGEVPVGSWEVAYAYAQCIHRLKYYPKEYHGIDFNMAICRKPYFSGWVPYCADCGERITGYLHYMSREAAKSIDSIDVELGYYYLCPSCNHLEQGVDGRAHSCKQISYNRYRVVYDSNEFLYGGNANGSTPPSFHMYNNETVFEGRKVTPNTHLTLNGYVMKGCYFTGWNTEPDGSGTFYADGAEIYNLSEENYSEDAGIGTVTLYAQWEKTKSNLVINPNGGSYLGTKDNTVIRQEYGTTYTLATATVVPPDGYTVSFETNGGNALPDEKSSREFEKWSLQTPFSGALAGEEYQFYGEMEDTDIVKAIYIHHPVTLPTPVKENVSFGGWYRDTACTEPAGDGGDLFTPGENTVLYAKWTELVLSAKNNYAVNGGKGAVDLSWNMIDGKNNAYKLYQCPDGGEFEQIYGAQEATRPELPDNIYGCDKRTRTITVPYTGFYSLSASGAQGGDYGEYRGGKGGTVTGKFYLNKGEILTFTVGGQDGFNGGGSAASYGSGGGFTIISSDQKGTLLIGGGGGGATSGGDGGNGGEEVGLLEQEPSTMGNAGENGLAGGGGGYQGGGKGNVAAGVVAEPVKSFDYRGAVEAFTVPKGGLYKLEVWGAQGSGSGTSGAWRAGGKGGYSAGYLELKSGDVLHICVGGAGRGGQGGYNGGGNCNVYGSPTFGAGGGATHIATRDRGVLANYNDHRAEILIVAGGGAGSMVNDDWHYSGRHEDHTTWNTRIGGTGGGTNGGVSAEENWCDGGCISYSYSVSGWMGYPTQTSGYAFGKGESVEWGCGGGGGWYGGYSYAGGSGYIGGTPKITMSGSSFFPAAGNGQRSGNGAACITRYENIVEPSYGGSSYVNTKYAVTYSLERGSREGDGAVSVKSLTIGFFDEQRLNGVFAPDLAAPDAIREADIEIKEAGDNAVTVMWKKPTDNGTVYYHKAEGYEAGTEQPKCVSNITGNVLVSGVAEYYYVMDGQPDTQADSSNGQLLKETKLTVELTGKEQYLHLSAADVAGNISATTHIRIDGTDAAQRLFTEPLYINSMINGRDNENIYPASEARMWYVRADGNTSFLLSFESYMEGNAREDYQINYQILDSRVSGADGMEQKYITRLPLTMPLSSTEALDSAGFVQRTEGGFILQDGMYTKASRNCNAERVSFGKAFVLNPELHGRTITVTPTAGADFRGKVVYSDWERDSQNALRIIADGAGPSIHGMEVLSGQKVINRGNQTVNLSVTASDELSGVRDLYLKIYNTDNFGERTCRPDENGFIRVDITEKDSLFTGDFTVTAYAVDNVGNVSEQTCRVTEFALETKVERILEPHTPIFKRGESGILSVTTYGYADRVEVEFPQELAALTPELNKTFINTTPLYREELQLQFMIPLYAPENENYKITVRAYKGDKKIEDYPAVSVIEVDGSVLDELRTRLR